jgi:hypothetical protein
MTEESRTSNSRRADRANAMEYSATELAQMAETIFHGIQRLSWFTGSVPCDDTIVKVFPQLAMSLQINEYRGLLPSFIRDEIDASHVASRWRLPRAKK